MQYSSFILSIAFIATLLAFPAKADKENFKIFLCFGQSNISGGMGCGIIDSFKNTTDRVMAFAFNNCGNPSWQRDTWVPAQEPLHCGDGGVGDQTMGPCYVFGKAMADSLPDDTIGIIPCGQSGVNIEHFIPGGRCTQDYCIPFPANTLPQGKTDVYDWMMNRCKLAMERGILAGIILHQGEANNGDAGWPGKIKQIYDLLKEDLELEDDIPLVAGQLLNGANNDIVGKIPETLPFGYVASSEGLNGGGNFSTLHFDTTGYVKMGERMAVEMMKGLNDANLITNSAPRKRLISSAAIKSTSGEVRVYSLDGRMVSSSIKNSSIQKTNLRPGNMYIVRDQSGNSTTKLMMIRNQ